MYSNIKKLKLFWGEIINEIYFDISVGKESFCNAGDSCLILGQEDPPEKGHATHSSVLGLP